ncbi:hypothetical protein [Maribacter sp.]
MQAIFQKYYGAFLLVLGPIVFISTMQSSDTSKELFQDNLVVINSEVYSQAKFDTGVETTYDGTEFTTLNLHMQNEYMSAPHSVEVIISKKSDSGVIGPGKYKVVKDKDGFLNYRDGVFGFLDSKDSDKLPFFAHFGEITIAELDDDEVNGHLNMYFKNAVGDSIHMRGEFSGRP